MINVKRLNNLKLLREKNLYKISREINTLCGEIKKCNDLKKKLKVIKDNSKFDYQNKNSWNIKHKHDFDIKILEQIAICMNRAQFLERELVIAKSKLGKIISQKKIIEEKIKVCIIKTIQEREDKLLRDSPPYRKS